MSILFNAREFAVRDRSSWSSAKARIFDLLKTASVEAVADALRQDKRPARHLQERYTEPASQWSQDEAVTWLMASQVSRSGENWEITVVYFGIERNIPCSELTAGDILHSDKVCHEEYLTSWRGRVFVVEAAPDIGTPPSPLRKVFNAIVFLLAAMPHAFIASFARFEWLKFLLFNLHSINHKNRMTLFASPRKKMKQPSLPFSTVDDGLETSPLHNIALIQPHTSLVGPILGFTFGQTDKTSDSALHAPVGLTNASSGLSSMRWRYGHIKFLSLRCDLGDRNSAGDRGVINETHRHGGASS